MIKYILALLLLLSPHLCYPQPANGSFQKAGMLLQKGDYKNAISIYEELAKKGNSSPGLYINLGNVYRLAGNTGKAMLYYERGLQKWPGNAMLQHNRDLLNDDL